jgi:hypothetical protein
MSVIDATVPSATFEAISPTHRAIVVRFAPAHGTAIGVAPDRDPPAAPDAEGDAGSLA